MSKKVYPKRTLIILFILLIASIWTMFKLRNYAKKDKSQITIDISLVEETEEQVKVAHNPTFCIILS